MREGVIRRALVVAPLSTLESVHAQTIYQNFIGPYQRTYTVLHGARDTRLRLCKNDFDFYIVNFDGWQTVAKALLARGDIDLVLIDEIAVLRNAGTQRWKIAKNFIQPHMWVWGMTGAPTPNEPTDAYAQVKLVRPEALGPFTSMRSFKFATMEQVTTWKWRPKPNAMHVVAKVMQPAIRYTRDECLDLPPLVTTVHDVELTPAQKKAYRDLMKLYATQVNGAQITAINEGVKMMRLVQTVSGVLYDRDGEHQVVDCAPRLALVKELIEESDSKVIIFVPFKGNLTLLTREIGKMCSVAEVSGDTKKKDRDAIFQAFQQGRDPHCLIMHPACTSHGLDLTAASTMIWWAPINSNDTFEQANARPNRSGQKHKMALRLLSGTAVEKQMYKRLEEREGMQGLLLDLLKNAVN
jgi:SNF2 family DNA or RNA helicase